MCPLPCLFGEFHEAHGAFDGLVFAELAEGYGEAAVVYGIVAGDEDEELIAVDGVDWDTENGALF